jgi:DUF4097 and DUF4098 domain-containing protein YvlB
MPRHHRAALLAALVSVVTSPLAAQQQQQQPASSPPGARGCSDRWYGGDDDSGRHCEVRETRLRATGSALVVDGRENGGVSVRGWDGDSILVRAIVQTHTRDGSDADAAAIARNVSVRTSGTIRADGPETRRGASWAVSYEIYVPRRSDITVDTHNGPITVRDVSGRMRLSAVNGPLTLDAVGGEVKGRTQNGPLRVSLTGSRWDGAGLDAETSNGPVSIVIPENYSAHLVTGTVNGPMRINFPMTLQGRIGRRLETDLGSGGPTVRAVTTNGPLTVSQKS